MVTRVQSAGVTLEPAGDLESIRDEWTTAAQRSGNVFATWEWAVTWWRHFGAGRPLLVTVCRDGDGRLLGVLPLYLSTARPLRVVRFIGSGPADRQGPIGAPDDRPALARALLEALAGTAPSWDVLLAERLPCEESWDRLLGAVPIQREGCPVLEIAGRSWDELLASASANFRQQVRSRERRLARSHRLRYRLTDDPARLSRDVATLVRLHEARWGSAGSGAFRARRRAFHEEFAGLALRRGWLRLWFLELDDRPVAAWYGFRYGGAEWFYQGGRDPAYDRLSVGFVLMAHTIREAADAGLARYHLLRGDEPYKARFASADPGLATAALVRGARGRAALAAARAARALPPRGRRLLVRLAGGGMMVGTC
jgi:CelD/BcsL family acetyltransferase involved in cellulose biosynthesis